MKRDFNFYSAHVVYLDNRFYRKMKFIGIKQVQGRSTADEISRTAINILKDVSMSLANCFVSVTDGASPLRSFSNNHEIKNVHCICHVLNLIFEEFAEIKEVRGIRHKSQGLASFLSRNKNTRKELQSKLSSSAYVDETRPYKLTKQQSSLIGTLVEILEPIYQQLMSLQGDDTFVSEILPSLQSLKEEISEKTDKYSKHLVDIVEKRISEYVTNDFVISSCLADPRFAFTPELLSPRTWEEAIEIFRSYDDSDAIPVSVASQTQNTSEPKKGVRAYMQKKFALNSTVGNDVETELLKYRALLNSNRPDIDSSPLHFWSTHANSFPIMVKVARRLLAAPASSSASERLFSKCSDVARQSKRAGIKTETLNSILMTTALTKMSKEPIEDCFISDDEEEDESDFLEDTVKSSDSESGDESLNKSVDMFGDSQQIDQERDNKNRSNSLDEHSPEL